MMKKYLIYDHNDEDFWIMDDDNWFASGKQKKSPVNRLIDLSEQYTVSPVIYFETKILNRTKIVEINRLFVYYQDLVKKSYENPTKYIKDVF